MPTCQKISILLQFGNEILALLCHDDSMQILLILSQFHNVGRCDVTLQDSIGAKNYYTANAKFCTAFVFRIVLSSPVSDPRNKRP